MRGALLGIASVVLSATVASAQPKPLPRVAVGAIGEVGETSKNSKVAAALERDIASLGLAEVISSKRVTRALTRAKKPQLLACEGDRSCLAETGRIAGAKWIIGVEVGGLGDVRVLHLKLIRAKDGRAIRSTTSTLTGNDAEAGKLVQLLAPKKYRGSLAVKTTVEGADVIVDAKHIGTTPAAEASLRVGTRALRITHPNYRDHVRFIEIEYGKTTTVEVEMAALDVSRQKLERQGGPLGSGGEPGSSRPWYGRWYVLAGIGAVVLIGSASIWAATSDDVDADREVGLP